VITEVDLKTVSESSQTYLPSHYEKSFGSILGADVHSFSFWKGRVALYAILLALGIGEGDEVILPGFTCVVVPNAVRLTGAKPVYIDILPGTYHLDPARVEAAITPRTRAIIIQHTFGIPGSLDPILGIGATHNLYLIEDACHTLGSTYRGKSLGLFGDAAFFSSQWSKPYTTGLGGMAVTRSNEIAANLDAVQRSFEAPPAAAQAKLALQYGIYQRFYSPQVYWTAQASLQRLSRLGLFVGSSSDSELAGEMPVDHRWRMAPYQERAGLKKLARVPDGIAQRQMITRLYDMGLSETGWPTAYRCGETVLLRYPVCVSNKEELLDLARKERIELGSWFETPLHPAPLNQHAVFDYQLGQCPNAERTARQVVNLPMHAWMTLAEAELVLQFFLKHARSPGSQHLSLSL
jgi:perosamine synthetase